VAAKRETSVDLLKSLAIVLVVLGHAIQYTVRDFDLNPLFRIIYSFHMPLFMFVSGYLAFRKKMQSSYLYKRFASLVVPFAIWLVIYSVFYNFNKIMHGQFGSVISFVKEGLLFPDHGGLWFLWVLFLIEIFHVFAQSTTHKYLILAGISVGLYLTSLVKVPIYFGLLFVRWHLFFFAMGLAFREYGFLNKISYKSILLMLPFLVVSESSWSRMGSNTFGFHLSSVTQSVYNLANSYLVATLSIVLFFKIATTIKRSNTYVVWLSENTLAVYAIHGMILILVVGELKEILQESILMTCLTFITTVLISIGMIRIIQINPGCRRFLFGKQPPKLPSRASPGTVG